MKISFRATLAILALTGFVSAPALADNAPAADTNKPPATAAAPAKPVAKKPVQTKGAAQPAAKKAEPKPAPVFHPEAAVAKQANVNIRGQALLNSEIVGHLKKGDAVTILEEINLKKAKQDEPSRWFRIALPPQAGAWVHASFVDAGAVKATRLNLRGGPGEEFSILGRIEKGTPIKQLETKGDWIKIEAPTNSYGFVAAHLLEKTPMTIAVAPVAPKTNEIVSTPTTTETVTPPAIPAIPETPTVPTTPVVTVPPATPPVTAPADPLPDAPIEKVKKIVTREGILKGSVSIQAPTYFELRSLDTGKTIDYVFSPSTNLLLREFKGKRILVTGEELLDERWQNTPVIIVDTLQTVP